MAVDESKLNVYARVLLNIGVVMHRTVVLARNPLNEEQALATSCRECST